MFFWLFAVFFALLSFLDLVTTLLLIKVFGSEIESNPIASSIYSHYGFKGMALIKLITIAIVMTIALYIRLRGYRFYPYLIFWTGSVIYLFTVVYALTLHLKFV